MNEAVVDSQIQPSMRVNNESKEGLSSARIVVQSPFHSGGYLSSAKTVLFNRPFTINVMGSKIYSKHVFFSPCIFSI